MGVADGEGASAAATVIEPRFMVIVPIFQDARSPFD